MAKRRGFFARLLGALGFGEPKEPREFREPARPSRPRPAPEPLEEPAPRGGLLERIGRGLGRLFGRKPREAARRPEEPLEEPRRRPRPSMAPEEPAPPRAPREPEEAAGPAIEEPARRPAREVPPPRGLTPEERAGLEEPAAGWQGEEFGFLPQGSQEAADLWDAAAAARDAGAEFVTVRGYVTSPDGVTRAWEFSLPLDADLVEEEFMRAYYDEVRDVLEEDGSESLVAVTGVG